MYRLNLLAIFVCSIAFGLDIIQGSYIGALCMLALVALNVSTLDLPK